MTEYLDYLLPRHCLLNTAVQCAQILLLGQEKAAALRADLLCRIDHDRHHHYGNNRQRNIQNQHGNQRSRNRSHTADQLGNTLADHLPHGIDVVGIHRHDIPVGMGVKVLDGQPLHFFKQVVAQIALGSLRHIDHDPGLGEGSYDSQSVKADHSSDGSRQRPEIRVLLLQHGRDIVVDQRPDKQRSLQSCKNGGDNTYYHDHPLKGIILQRIPQHSLQQFSGILYLRSRSSCASGAGTLIHFRFSLFRHDHMPPFSSKSPLPAV